ncbi:hypothetical protein [Photobacterium kishitanii]|uniref:Uncharacterized protein n=1 Tax=Photobacterium kishitanii TaxID=318456 RepID=A0A2T3KKV9_9GAMM|nr:hypothetical protein [Photobacterium kishitanii]PSV00355.1 hypothetical protein C9J27_04305 [Photobacterium kishitanii]
MINNKIVNQKIRKNATVKITSLLNKAVGIIFSSKAAQVDGSYENGCEVATPEMVLDWLADGYNYSNADIRLYGDVLTVDLKYGSSEKFEAYFKQEEFDVISNKLFNKAHESEAVALIPVGNARPILN